MKKLILVIVLLACFSGTALAADAITVTTNELAGFNVRIVIIEWTDTPALALSSSYTEIIKFMRGWYVYKAITSPGAAGAQPTDLYDVTLTQVIPGTTGTVDIMGGELANRSNASNQEVVPKVDSVYGPQPITGDLTLNVTNNSNASGTGVIVLFLAKYLEG